MSDATYLYANQVHFEFGLCKLNICVCVCVFKIDLSLVLLVRV